MKIYLVGGTFDEKRGKASGLIAKIYWALKEQAQVADVQLYNGGHIETLRKLHDENLMEDADAIMWFANVPNEFEKYRDIKKHYPRKLLVTSKRNHDEYKFNYLVNHALGLKANLVIEFSRGEEGRFQTRLFDPLGAVWVDRTYDIQVLVEGLVERLAYLKTVKRIGTRYKEGVIAIPNESEFVSLVKQLSDRFHDLIHPAEGVTRFLGNASFRCRHGFPSFRHGDKIFVSRRNIDKRNLGLDGFVPVQKGKDGKIYYYGEYKPSVDTPIQLALYESYQNVNYMVHSHVYIEDAPFTEVAVPCGGLQEVKEIQKIFPDRTTTNVAINLIGHGSLILANSVQDIEGFLDRYISRPIPEVMNSMVMKC
ncbi:hypothetical protein D5F11_008735 [Siminovitchia terrae]|uniref:Class II aldolase/adducin N-terminal domain-containing protein n=1 Tax=Siminovitchia terrae TaxID=1914933 RepID=A0A429X9P9_SIMTE|nr:class II aldolase/adducin family protein [Siminovitchia terrae]RST60134.1 hypothetical protein D5F11_008735 [Siminovitchia terrae]